MGARIKSIQYGTVVVTDGNSSGTATINSVDINNSIIMFLGKDQTDPDGDNGYRKIALTNATTVTATRIGISSTGITGFVVLEFESPGVASVCAGEVVLGVGVASATATINSVDINKALLVYLGETINYGDVGCYQMAYLTLTNATTVTATRYYSTTESIVGFMVLELY